MSVAGDINDTARAIKCIDKNADRLMCKIEVVSITISGSVDTSSKRKVPSPPPLSLSFSLIKKLNISCAWTGKLWNYASTDYGMRWWIYFQSLIGFIYLFLYFFDWIFEADKEFRKNFSWYGGFEFYFMYLIFYNFSKFFKVFKEVY